MIDGDVRRALNEVVTSPRPIPGTKAIVISTLRTSGETGEAALRILSRIARAAVRQTADVHGDVGKSAKGLVLGAIASAKLIGLERSTAASSAAQAAVDEAESIGWAASTRVRGMLRTEIGGILVVIRERPLSAVPSGS